MRAPVYRSIDAGNTLLGLAFPSEVLLVLVAFWGSAAFLKGLGSLLVTLAAYAFLRLSTLGRPPLFLQHALLFHVRRSLQGGRFSAAARAAQPRFPHAPYSIPGVELPSRR
jgi:hypothetical protein